MQGEGGVEVGVERTIGVARQCKQTRERLCTYLHPASAILRAYIFPMSPIPMMPTTASPILTIGEPRAQRTRLAQEKAWYRGGVRDRRAV
jgi:hypothetical protein